MLSPKRLFLWSALAALLLSAHPEAWAQEYESGEEPEMQRRQLWDFFSFISLLNFLGPPCTRPDGKPDWGPINGPRWKACSREASYMPTSAPSGGSGANVNNAESSTSYLDSSGTGGGRGGQFDGGTFSHMAQGFQLWMLFAAGSVVSAMVAIHLGQRKDGKSLSKHGMTGSVMRRVGAVSAFAAGAFPSKGKSVEMQSPRPEYRLDMSPETEPSATV